MKSTIANGRSSPTCSRLCTSTISIGLRLSWGTRSTKSIAALRDRRRSAAAVPGTATGGPVDSVEPVPSAGAHVKRVTAPLTGVFYRSSSPDTEAFVDVGDRVENGDVLCILEAMKLFNEIQSDYAGTIVRILPENGELVSQGADLFWIEP